VGDEDANRLAIVGDYVSLRGIAMPLINTDGLTLIGPGSEWFWTAVSGLVLAGTFVALYRQLRLQANATATDQLTEFEREWASERLLRFQLAVLLELKAGVDPADLNSVSAHSLFNFWERIGALARGGRIDPKLLALVNGGVSEWWWSILKGYVMRRRADLGPTFGESFEWLNGVISKINRKSGIYDFDRIGDLDGDIRSIESLIRVEEGLRSVPVSSPPPPMRRAGPRRTAPGPVTASPGNGAT